MSDFTVEQMIDAAVDVVRPEAREFVAILSKGIKTTKDNYGRVLALLSKLEGETAPLFLIAMVREGYPADTADQLVTLFQWPVSVREAIERTASQQSQSVIR